VAVVVGGLGVTGVGLAKSKPPAKLHLKANASGKLKFNKTQLTVKHGRVTLIMKNPGSSGQEHGIAVKGQGLDKDGPIVAPGKTATVTVKLSKGSYTFYCPVPGHAQAGMKGTITVN
jgi:plastocyanin